MYKILFLYFFLIIVHILIKPVNSSILNNELKFIKNSSKHICKVLIGKEKLNIEWNKVSKNYKTLYHKNKILCYIFNISKTKINKPQ